MNLPTNYWYAIGYLCIKKFAFRVDVFEKIFFLARKKIKYGPFLETSELMNPIGCNSQQLNEILSFCGYSSFKLKDDKYLYFSRKIEKNKKINKKNKLNLLKPSKKKKTIKKDPNSPFAVLEKLL